MKRIGSMVSLAMFLVVLVAGCAQTENQASQPEQLIDAVMKQCPTQDYGPVVQHFVNGSRLWEIDRPLVQHVMDRICGYGQAKGYAVRDRLEGGQSAVLIQVITYRDVEQTEALLTMTWHFAREGRRWMITQVE